MCHYLFVTDGKLRTRTHFAQLPASKKIGRSIDALFPMVFSLSERLRFSFREINLKKRKKTPCRLKMDAFYAISTIRKPHGEICFARQVDETSERKVDEKEKEKNANLKTHEVAREVRNPERIER